MVEISKTRLEVPTRRENPVLVYGGALTCMASSRFERDCEGCPPEGELLVCNVIRLMIVCIKDSIYTYYEKKRRRHYQ